MTYKLFLDDKRDPKDKDQYWVVCRTSDEAIKYVVDNGMPLFMSLDHDLGGDDTAMAFLKWLDLNKYDEGPPPYQIHSENVEGRKNILAFMESWRKSRVLVTV